MKNIKRFIKGIFITMLLVGAFTMSTQSVSHPTTNESVVKTEISLTQNWIPQAYAQQAANPSTANQPKAAAKIPDELISAINKASSLVNKLFNPLIYFFTRHIGNFMGNDYIYGGNMGEMLQRLWVISRNIVNIVFVLVLLFLAVRYIFGSDEGSDLKKVLPMFVLMLVAVNFSWLGARLLLDAANVATNVAFSIPSGVNPANIGLPDCIADPDNEGNVKGACGIKEIWFPFDATAHTDLTMADCQKLGIADQYKKAYPTDKTKKGDNTVDAYQQSAICWEKLDPGKFSQSNAAYQITYGMAKVQNLPKAPPGSSISSVGIGTFFAILIQLVYIAAFGTLFIALVMRAAVLWLFVAFSPFIVLAIFLKSANLPVPGEDKIGIKAFAKWAFAPTKVAAVWSVGFIMIAVGQTGTNNVLATLNQQGEVVTQVFTIQSLFMGMETMQELIWLIMTVGIIWLGTFWALNDLELVNDVIAPIKSTGNTLFKQIATSPKWAPIIPMLDPKTGQMSRTSLEKSQFNVVGRLRDYRSKVGTTNYTGYKKGADALKTASSDKIAEIRSSNPNTAYGAMRSITNLSSKELANKAQVVNMLKGSGQFKSNEIDAIADRISKRAANLPGTAAPPSASGSTNTNSNLTAEKQFAATKRGVIEGLKTSPEWNGWNKAQRDAATNAVNLHKDLKATNKDLIKIATDAANNSKATNAGGGDKQTPQQ